MAHTNKTSTWRLPPQLSMKAKYFLFCRATLLSNHFHNTRWVIIVFNTKTLISFLINRFCLLFCYFPHIHHYFPLLRLTCIIKYENLRIYFIICEISYSMKKKCLICGKKLKNQDATHCSEKCLFKSIEKSKSILDSK